MTHCNINHQNNIQNVTDVHKEFFQSVTFYYILLTLWYFILDPFCTYLSLFRVIFLQIICLLQIFFISLHCISVSNWVRTVNKS